MACADELCLAISARRFASRDPSCTAWRSPSPPAGPESGRTAWCSRAVASLFSGFGRVAGQPVVSVRLTVGSSPVWAMLARVMSRDPWTVHASFCWNRRAPTRRVPTPWQRAAMGTPGVMAASLGKMPTTIEGLEAFDPSSEGDAASSRRRGAAFELPR